MKKIKKQSAGLQFENAPELLSSGHMKGALWIIFIILGSMKMPTLKLFMNIEPQNIIAIKELMLAMFLPSGRG